MFQFWLSVVFPVFLGCVSIATIFALKRRMLKGGEISPLQFLTASFGSAALLFGVFYIINWGFTMPAKLLPGFWVAVICGSAVNVIIQFFNAKAASLAKGEVSLTVPLQAMTPGLITILALLLGEFPGTTGIVGVGLMICGSYVLLWERTPNRWWEYFGPLKRLVSLIKLRELPEEEQSKTMAVCLSLGSAAFGTVGLLFDGLYVRRGVDLQGLVLAAMSMVGILAFVYLVFYLVNPDSTITQQGHGYLFPLRRTFLVFVGVFGIAWILHILAIQPAYNKTFVAHVGTLKRFSVLLTVLFGYLFFRETEIKKRFWAAALIVLGALFISFDGLPERLSHRVEFLGF